MKKQENGTKNNILIIAIFVLLLFVGLLFTFNYTENDNNSFNNQPDDIVTPPPIDDLCEHNYVELEFLYVAGDCLVKDKITYKCSKCGHTYTQEGTYCHSWNFANNTCNNCGMKYEDYDPNE